MMKTFVALTVAAVLGLSTYADEAAKPDKPIVPAIDKPVPPADKPSAPATIPNMPARQAPEMAEAKILKVFSADVGGYKYRAYLVSWKDAEVVVDDPMGMSEKKEGDILKFMAQKIDMPRGKTIRFMVMDFPMPKKPESKDPAQKTPAAKPATP